MGSVGITGVVEAVLPGTADVLAGAADVGAVAPIEVGAAVPAPAPRSSEHAVAASSTLADTRNAPISLTRATVTVASSPVMSPTPPTSAPPTPNAPAPLPIILDCDPGHDDAIAIVVAARHTELVGITTVSGNAPLTSTTRNAIIMRDLLGLDCPVHAGSNRPLLREPRHAGYVHGVSGLDGADLPEPSGPPASHDAVGYLIEACRAREGIWLVPTGPLTNIALALRAAPDLARRIAGISLMGGGTFGNTTAAAEFNLLCDPEAADIVFSYGGPLIMAGLDVTHQFQAVPERIAMVRALPGHLAAVLADLFDFFSATYKSRHHHIAGAAVHDPCAVMALTHPHLFTRRFAHVEIETQGRLTAGMTVIDQRDLKEVPDPNCDLLVGVEADAAWQVVVDSIAHFSR